MPYFAPSPQKTFGMKGLFQPLYPSKLVPSNFGLFPKIQFVIKTGIFSVAELSEQRVPRALKATGPKRSPQIVMRPSSSVGRSVRFSNVSMTEGAGFFLMPTLWCLG